MTTVTLSLSEYELALVTQSLTEGLIAQRVSLAASILTQRDAQRATYHAVGADYLKAPIKRLLTHRNTDSEGNLRTTHVYVDADGYVFARMDYDGRIVEDEEPVLPRESFFDNAGC